MIGPVTRAIAAMRPDEPDRRTILGSIGAALTGTIIGQAVRSRDDERLAAIAEGYVQDAKALGMCLTIGPDGQLWRGMPVTGTAELFEARDAHDRKLYDRPGLFEAVEKRLASVA